MVSTQKYMGSYIEEKAMREHSSLHQSQRAVIQIIFDHFSLLFNENATECSYDGVNCDGNDVGTNIWLSRRGLSGTIPTSLAQLPKLIGLYLGGNNITGSIPTEFGKMDNLETLWLENNALTGTIPTEIISMQNLRALNLAQNKLSGALPKFIVFLNQSESSSNSSSASLARLLSSPSSTSPSLYCMTNEFLVTLVIHTDEWSYENDWEVQHNGAVIESGGGYGVLQKYTEEFCVPYNCYTLVVYDSYGNGLCNEDYYDYEDFIFYYYYGPC